MKSSTRSIHTPRASHGALRWAVIAAGLTLTGALGACSDGATAPAPSAQRAVEAIPPLDSGHDTSATAGVARSTEQGFYASLGEGPLRIWVQYNAYGSVAYLAYQVFDWSTYTTHEGGYGEVPTDLIEGSVQSGRVRFEVNTADLPGLDVWAGSGGTISLTLVKDGEWWSQGNTHREASYPGGVTVRSSGHSVEYSAEADGHVMGWTAPQRSANLRQFRNHDVRITRQGP